MLEGEKAQRTETARLLQDMQRRVASVPPGTAQDVLAAKKKGLEDKLKQQSGQVTPITIKLVISTSKTSHSGLFSA